MAKAMVESIVVVAGGGLLLMFLLIFLLILLACKPWRFFFYRSSGTRTRTIKSQVDDIERPLVSEDLHSVPIQANEFAGNYAVDEACYPAERHFSSPKTHGVGHKHRIQSTTPQVTQSGSYVLDVISDPSEDIFIGQTLKRPLTTQQYVEEQKSLRKEDQNHGLKPHADSDSIRKFVAKGGTGNSLTLEVIAGPARGLRYSVRSTNASRLPLTLGRVAPSDLILKDSEVSGKHALINWNLNKLKWEVVDMGSLNGTLLNSKGIHHPDTGSRHWGDPTELTDGDIITLGTSTKVSVRIESQTECLVPFRVGLASDPMALRRGGKKLPMEDVCYYQWPLPGVDQFGLFGICDGHGGADAATYACKILAETVASILSDPYKRDTVVSQTDASDILKEAFLQTEACMNHYYEGCTATMLLIWADGQNFYVQCANVGDSACVLSIGGKLVKMTEDHRITSNSERLRMQETGEPLKDGETRLCGLNLGRTLGDKFLKQQEARFSAEPYISQVALINEASGGFAVIASDGFWDVVNSKKAVQLVQQAREKYAGDKENSAEKIANFLLSEARMQRTKDNTSIIFLDFDSINRIPACDP